MQVGFPCLEGTYASIPDADKCNPDFNNELDPDVSFEPVTKSASGQQCKCNSRPRTVYPYEVDQMNLTFTHTFRTTDEMLGGHSGPAKTTTVVWGGERRGEVSKFGGNEEVTFPVADWLKYATDSSTENPDGSINVTQGVLLDDLNQFRNQSSDSFEGFNQSASEPLYPRVRTTGIRVNVYIDYDNLNKDGNAETYNKNVKAKVTTRADVGRWAGPGGRVDYTKPRTGARNKQSWKLTSKYYQGIIFDFHPTGHIYQLDGHFLLNTLIGGFVMLGLCNIVSDLVAFYLLPNGQSTILRNKRAEKVSKKSEYAEYGLKTALHAATFGAFDKNSNGLVYKSDLMRVFAKVPSITAEQAHSITTMIFKSADKDRSTDLEQADISGNLDFAEFVQCVSDDGISSFDMFLKHLPKTAGASDFQACKKIYDAERPSHFKTLPNVAP